MGVSRLRILVTANHPGLNEERCLITYEDELIVNEPQVACTNDGEIRTGIFKNPDGEVYFNDENPDLGPTRRLCYLRS